MAYFPYYGLQSTSYLKPRPAETFSIRIWPLDGFEFETPYEINPFLIQLDNVRVLLQNKTESWSTIVKEEEESI